MDIRSVTSASRPKSVAGAVRDLSCRLAATYGAARAILVDHGSTAIRAALRAVQLAGGMRHSAVVVPCNVWRGVYSSVAFAGCRAIELVDVDPVKGVLGPDLSPSLSDIDVVLAVDGYGVKPAIAEIRQRCRLPVIEDASLSQTPSRNTEDRLAADICIMSLQSNKLLSCGEGGLVLTDRQDLAALVEAMVCDGRPWLDEVCDEPVTMGFNGMMSEDVAEVLATHLAQNERYLEGIARGASFAISRLEAAEVPAWLDRALVEAGRLFALPLSFEAREKLNSPGIRICQPPFPPTDRLKELLAQLPAAFTVHEAYPHAADFARRHGLILHWDLHGLGSR